MAAPTVTASIAANGNALTLAFSASVTGVRLADFVLKRDGVPVRHWQLSGSGASWSIRPRRQYDGDGVYTLTYTGTSVINGASEAMVAFADAAVTNNSTLSHAQAVYAGRSTIAFVVFNMPTFHDVELGDGTEDPDTFNPTALDLDQWLDVAAAMGADAAILTLKHHDGFALWDSATQPHNVTAATTWWAAGGFDIGVAFYEKCRARGVEPIAYLSVRDVKWELDHPAYDSTAYTAFVVDQVEELKAIGYRKFWTDSWGWSLVSDYTMVDPATVRAAIYAGDDPESLLIENNHEHDLSHTDIDVYEVGISGEHEVAFANANPAELAESIASNGWFWKSTGTTLKTLPYLQRQAEVLCNSRRGVYSLAVLPDNTGVVPADQVALLASFGAFGSGGAVDLAGDLEAYYALDDATDSTGNHGLTNATGVTFPAGKVGNGADFEASSTQELTVADAAGLRVTGAKTFAIWYRRESVQGYDVLLSKYTEAAGQKDYLLDIFGEEVRWNADGTGVQGIPASPVGEWDCVFGWHDPDAFGGKILLQRGDGPIVKSTSSGGFDQSASPFRLGHRGDAGFPGWFDGLLDECLIVNRVLTPAERRAFLNGGVGRTYSTLTDATAPATPTNFLASIVGTAATVTWDANAESDLAGYRLYHSTDGAAWSLIRDLAAVDDHHYGLALSELTGANYYRITAYDWFGNESSASASSPAVPPTAGTLSEVSHTATTATLSWTAATAGTGTITDQLQRSPAGAGTWANVTGATTSPATDSGLSPETAYDYRVAYTDDATTVYSGTVTVTTDEIPVPTIGWTSRRTALHWTAKG